MAESGTLHPLPHQCNPTQCTNGEAPEIVETYGLVIPVSAVRSRIRQEFERHRYVQELQVIDVLLFKGLAEYQARPLFVFSPLFVVCALSRDKLICRRR